MTHKLIVRGYTISVPGHRNTVKVTTPNGGQISCLKRGTHAALKVLPKDVRAEIAKATGWVIS